VALFGLLVAAVMAAQASMLSGRVVDPQSAVVGNAQVTLIGSGAAERKTTRTAADGTFSFSGFARGTYMLEVDSPGFQRSIRQVTVGEPVTVTVMLQVAGVSEELTVSGTTPLNLAKPQSTASHLGLSPLETPASVAVLSGDVIRDMGTPSLVEAKTLAPGVSSSNSPGNGGNLLSARGFVGTNSVKQLFNGMEIYNAGGVVSFPFDPWMAERIETLYGPSAILYGTGTIGGAVNVVPRRPDPVSRHNEVTLGAGRFNTFHEAIDSTGPMGDRWSYRFNLSRYDSKGWIDRGDSHSTAGSMSVRYDQSQDLRFTLSNDFGYQSPQQYLGTPVTNGAVVEALRFKNYNIADAQLWFGDNWTNLETVWTPRRNITFQNNTYVMYHDRRYRDVTIFTYVPASSAVRRTTYRDIGSDADSTYETQYGDTGYFKIAGSVGGHQNDVVAGFDLNRNYYHRNDNNRGGTSSVDALNPVPGNYLDVYKQESIPFYRMRVNQAGLFLEDRFQATSRLSLVGGLRADHYFVNRYDAVTLLTTTSSYNPVGWNAGAVFMPVGGFSIYGQVAAATDPVNSLPSIAANQQPFNLSDGRQQEGGVKGQMWNNHVEWTAAVYHITKTNLLTPVVGNPSLSEQVGEQSSRGFEASFALNLGPLRVDVNGSKLGARFDDFKATVSGAVVSLAGNVPLNVPLSTWSMRAFWDAMPKLQVRAVVRGVGQRFADNTNSAAALVPSFTELNLGARVRVHPSLSFDVRVDNVTDELYVESGSAVQWLLGTPRAATVSMNVHF